ncbi:sensor histidine kinase inhibitor, KipI family [Arsukibacterium tuosuense]|uniref:Sensor histidine kinase inhibitor, KipI family n=2 Tax=Arsukibacterium tuosuense TaxID=1323745 RepID=A0A285J9Q2_9GAMM|nr:sensor histidine kinase inhibitor, KipI family [Arsukibacterium tuosuense]
MKTNMSKPLYSLTVASENAVMVYFKQKMAPDIAGLVQQAGPLIRQAMGQHLLELLPSYASVMVVFNPFSCDHFIVKQLLQQALSSLSASSQPAGRRIELPVYYSEQSGPDLALIAKTKQLSVAEVIKLHQQQVYRVYAIGFAPGFAYLGEVAEQLAMPRLKSPRAKVPRGAVAIADRQTAVYPAVSPGGWNLIGLCPTPMFQPDQQPPMPVAVGDEVQFVAISKAEFLNLGGEL